MKTCFVFSKKDQLIESQTKQIDQLKKYISETEEGSRSSEAWRREIESLKLKLKRLERDKEESSSANQLLNVRINSLDKILTLQEQALSKVSPQNYKNSRVLQFLLITFYRLKVL